MAQWERSLKLVPSGIVGPRLQVSVSWRQLKGPYRNYYINSTRLMDSILI